MKVSEKSRGWRLTTAGIVLSMAMIFSTGAIVASADSHGDVYDLSGKKVVVLAGEGLHDGETLFPIGFLVNHGAEVIVAGVEPGYVKAYNSDVRVRVEVSVDEISLDDIDAVVIPGGSSPANIREHENVVDFTRRAVEAGKIVAAICHGPQVLITAGVLEGRKATAFPNVAEELSLAGAEYEDVSMMRDGNIITSRIPDDLPCFVNALSESLLE